LLTLFLPRKALNGFFFSLWIVITVDFALAGHFPSSLRPSQCLRPIFFLPPWRVQNHFFISLLMTCPPKSLLTPPLCAPFAFFLSPSYALSKNTLLAEAETLNFFFFSDYFALHRTLSTAFSDSLPPPSKIFL